MTEVYYVIHGIDDEVTLSVHSEEEWNTSSECQKLSTQNFGVDDHLTTDEFVDLVNVQGAIFKGTIIIKGRQI